ncbi:hypothetical protein niasHS_009101 [Heterodera schachtii]|uniref:Gag protein n=1 Tax=Heterodera schachtii TaxID=97005 RepID=A0ABD2J1W2_HETSC
MREQQQRQTHSKTTPQWQKPDTRRAITFTLKGADSARNEPTGGTFHYGHDRRRADLSQTGENGSQTWSPQCTRDPNQRSPNNGKGTPADNHIARSSSNKKLVPSQSSWTNSSGQKRKWPEFYESFKSAIGSQSISKAQKLNLLRNLLGGEARELIAGFRLEDQNYETVLQLLKDTYGAPEEHIRALHFELANLKTCRSLRDTKDFLLQLERLTRELNNAGEDIEGPQVFLMLEKKLTPAFLRNILNKKGEDPANWTTTKIPGPHQAQRARIPTANFRNRNASPANRERTFMSSTIEEVQQRMNHRPQLRKSQQRGPRPTQAPYKRANPGWHSTSRVKESAFTLHLLQWHSLE